MIPEVVYGKYSQALFGIAEEQHKVEEFGKDLRLIRDTMQENEALRKFICHPLIGAQTKKDTLKQIFAARVTAMVMQFLYVMIDRRREAVIIGAIEGFITLVRQAQHIEVAKIRVVKPLTAEEEQKLIAGLEKITGKKIEPMYYTDPSIIGGITVQIGDRLIDGSVKRQLQDLQYKLLHTDEVNEVTGE
ncbi:F0F1 ATP synthase subunit delta [uncultured Megasphaera sp.]|uniref:F0F1 ATP synthase subunit delta n=1 Tax=uncultured Megasphaera sp. TaxID=165188 RepID=UPI0025989AAA|nr:F0F1 ATP synthase subunit delta [uncultured Megasphaera sp.]